MSRKRAKVAFPAKKDLDDIWLEIAQDKIDAADRFIDFVTDKFPLLASFPKMGRARDDLEPGLRSFPVKNYLILYRLVKTRIEIVRVVHGARDLKALFK
jgi:toxin ParE1/3/4